MKTFNYAAYKAKWRERAAHFGIDPETGATGYQVCLVQAEMRKAATIAQMRQRDNGLPWWADEALWRDDDPRSGTEREALENIRIEARRLRRAGWRALFEDEELPVDMVTLRDLWMDVRADLSMWERQRVPTVAEMVLEI